MTQEQANIVTLIGMEAELRGYELFNANGDNLGVVLSDEDVDFIRGHRCASDCRKIGCETVAAQARRAALLS